MRSRPGHICQLESAIQCILHNPTDRYYQNLLISLMDSAFYPLNNLGHHVTIMGSLRNDDENGNDNATNQLFDWLNEGKYRAARAARFLVQFFDAVCQTTTRNFHL